jgi:hypothetical protein
VESWVSWEVSAKLRRFAWLLHADNVLAKARHLARVAKANFALFHAEVTCLLKVARANGGTLRDKRVELHVDREICRQCEEVMPLVIRELGDPDVSYVDRTGHRVPMGGSRR